MITIRAGNSAIGICLLLLATGCSREQQDWRSAEAADTIEGYGQFIERHPESELATQARMRVAQLGEDRDWQHAGSADTVDAYRDFITQHPNGKWAQEARIRIENFSLGEQTGSDAASRGAAAASGAGAGVGVGRARAGGSTGAGVGVSASALAEERDRSSGGTGSPPPEGPDRASVGAAARADAGGSSGNTAADPGAVAARGLAAPGEAAAPAGAAGASMGGPGGAMSANGARAGGAGVGGSGAGGVGVSGAGAGGAGAGGARTAGFGIQLGAFSSEAAANNEWRSLAGRFGPELQGLTEHVVTVDTPSGRVYRLQAVIGDEARARAICDSLRKRSQGCVAVLPH